MHDIEDDATRWSNLVRNVTGNATQPAIARKTGIDQTTISRWLSGRASSPSVRAVVAFARGYKLDVIDALVVAGLITADDAKPRRRSKRLALVDVSTDELIAELGRRASEKVA